MGRLARPAHRARIPVAFTVQLVSPVDMDVELQNLDRPVIRKVGDERNWYGIVTASTAEAQPLPPPRIGAAVTGSEDHLARPFGPRRSDRESRESGARPSFLDGPDDCSAALTNSGAALTWIAPLCPSDSKRMVAKVSAQEIFEVDRPKST